MTHSSLWQHLDAYESCVCEAPVQRVSKKNFYEKMALMCLFGSVAGAAAFSVASDMGALGWTTQVWSGLGGLVVVMGGLGTAGSLILKQNEEERTTQEKKKNKTAQYDQAVKILERMALEKPERTQQVYAALNLVREKKINAWWVERLMELETDTSKTSAPMMAFEDEVVVAEEMETLEEAEHTPARFLKF